MDQRVATLDTCVLLPSRLRDTLLDAADAGLYQCRWSDDILGELQRNLAEETGNPEGAARLIAAMNEHFPEGLVTRRAWETGQRDDEPSKGPACPRGRDSIGIDDHHHAAPHPPAGSGICDAFDARCCVITVSLPTMRAMISRRTSASCGICPAVDDLRATTVTPCPSPHPHRITNL
jgi:hypothetical protein